MINNDKKEITLGVSVQKFKNKPDNWKILTYQRHTITIEKLINLICEGYCICQNFKTIKHLDYEKKRLPILTLQIA